MSPWLWLLVAALLCSAFFSASETALVSSDRLRQRADKERGAKLAGLAERLYHRPERTLSALLVSNNLANIIASISAQLLTERGLAAAGWRLPPIWADLFSALWISALVLVLGEILPKSVGRHYSARLTRAAAPLMITLRIVLRPVFWILDGTAWISRVLWRRNPRGRRGSYSWETVKMHLEAGRAEGVLGEQDEVLIQRIGQLNRLTAQSLMIPLEKLCLFPMGGRASDLKARLAQTRSPRAFLYRGDPRRLLGLVSARRLLGLADPTPVGSLAEPLRRVPSHRPLLELIDELQLAHSTFAVVTDPAGRSLGAVFLGDLLRQLVHFQQEWDAATKESGPPDVEFAGS